MELDLIFLTFVLFGIVWAPRTWAAGELVTAANMNSQLRDHLNALRGEQEHTADGTTHNLAIDGPFVYLKCTNQASTMFLTGFLLEGGNVGGARIIVEAQGVANVLLQDQHGSSTSTNRIITSTDQWINLQPKSGHRRALLIYDDVRARWIASILPDDRESNNTDNILVTDDFFGDNITNQSISKLKWSKGVNGSGIAEQGNVNLIGGPANSGIIVATTGITNPSYCLFYVGLTRYMTWDHVAFICRLRGNITNIEIVVGMQTVTAAGYGNIGVGGEGPDGAYFTFIPGSSANWRCVVQNGAATIVNSSKVVAANTWYVLEIFKNQAGKLRFVINDGYHSNTSTNLPDARDNQAAKFQIFTTDVNSKSLDCDYFAMKGWPPLTRIGI